MRFESTTALPGHGSWQGFFSCLHFFLEKGAWQDYTNMQRLDVCPAAQIGVCGGDIDGAEIGKFAGSENMLPMH